MELTRKTEYAIAVLTELATRNSDVYVQSKEIAGRRHIPENIMPQIAALLSRKGWIEGSRGVGGGLRLVADPRSISVLDCIELVEGPIYVNRCLKTSGCPSEAGCALRLVWVKAQQALHAVFSEATIYDLAKCE